ncbi:MAG: ankyrin repeat domain-containing protein [Elusimicrobia bacterium]|nr:ankyrin repeat domain-containing protein [Elusimicrobiota bacterium]
MRTALVMILYIFTLVFAVPGCAKKIMIPLDGIEKNDLGRVRYAVEHGADVNARDSEGRTALMRAAWKNSLDVAAYLIEMGADVNAKSRYGDTALLWARDKGFEDMIRLLRKNGAK